MQVSVIVIQKAYCANDVLHQNKEIARKANYFSELDMIHDSIIELLITLFEFGRLI